MERNDKSSKIYFICGICLLCILLGLLRWYTIRLESPHGRYYRLSKGMDESEVRRILPGSKKITLESMLERMDQATREEYMLMPRETAVRELLGAECDYQILWQSRMTNYVGILVTIKNGKVIDFDFDAAIPQDKP